MEEYTSKGQSGEDQRESKNEQPREHQDDIHSTVVRAGKRTYFFDVKSTRSNELYLTITESKKRFNQQSGRFFYEKHKLFLYQEDFEKFIAALKESFEAVDSLQGEIVPHGGNEGSGEEADQE
jgi:hypothetical protein